MTKNSGFEKDSFAVVSISTENMVHLVRSGRVKLVKCVTPAAFWIQCIDCAGKSTTPEYLNEGRYSVDYYPEKLAEVTVRDSDGFFYRGVLHGCRVERETSIKKYVVQLVDTFQVRDFLQKDVFPFSKEWLDCQNAHMVSLFNIFPVEPPSPCASTNEMNDAWLKLMIWDQNLPPVELFLTKAVKLTYKHMGVITGSLYGTLFADGSNLAKFIADNDLGIHCLTSSYFSHAVESLKSPAFISIPELLPTTEPPEKSKNLRKKGTCSEEKPLREEITEKLSLLGCRVVEDDKKLYDSLLTPFSFPFLYNDEIRPVAGEIPIRFVTPDGSVVLGSVHTPNVHYYEDLPLPNLPGIDKDRAASFTWHFNPYTFSQVKEPRKSDTDEIEEEFELEDTFFSYDLEEVRRNFMRKGCALKNTTSCQLRHPKIRPILNYITVALKFLGVSALREWQQACIPSMLKKKSMLIYGPTRIGKLTTTLVCVAAIMKYTVEKVVPGFPVCIVLVSDYSRAENAAIIVGKLNRTFVMFTSHSISSPQKKELSNPCEFLITTPAHLCSLIEDRDCKLDNVMYVVYDSLDSLNMWYDEKIKVILKMNVEATSFYLSSCYGSYFKEYVDKNAAVCITDFVCLTLYKQVIPTVIFTSDDWVDWCSSLKTIFRENKNCQLLLCSDETQVAAIEHYFNRNQVFILSDSTPKDEACNIADDWELSERSLLVCTDEVFQRHSFTRNANVLISFKGAYDWEQLVLRYQALIDGRRVSLPNKKMYLFCDSDNLQELLLHKNLLQNLPTFKDVKTKLDWFLSKALDKKEGEKLGELCQNYRMFGSCLNCYTCPFRHKLNSNDEVLLLNHTQYLAVDLLEVHSIFHLSVRINSVVTNHSCTDVDLSKFASKLRTISKELDERFASRSNVDAENLQVGQVVGAQVSREELRRVKVMSVSLDTTDGTVCLVKILDFAEPDARVNASELFQISADVASLENDVKEVYIVGLLPSDFNYDWAHDTKYVVNVFLERPIKDEGCSLLLGAIKFIINESIFVDSFHLMKNNDEGMAVSILPFPELAVKTGLIVKNHDHVKLLSESLLPDYSQERYGFRLSVPQEAASAIVPYYDNPSLFFINLTEELSALQELETSLEKSNLPRLQFVIPFEFCCVKADDVWNRGIIYQMNCVFSEIPQFIDVLCVDYGDVRTVPSDQIFSLPDKFLDQPYFAIACQLAGVKPLQDTWCEKSVQLVEDFFKTGDTARKISIKFHNVVNNDRSPRLYNQRLVVCRELQFPKNRERSVAEFLLDKQLAAVDRESAHFLKRYSHLKPKKK